jgi:peptidoglycan/xylan/chitin deacetylase (PgdA/CDA1 family)
MTWSTTVELIRIRCYSNSIGEYFGLDGFYTNVYPQGALLLTFDDGYISQFDEAFSYAQQTGVRATCSIVTGNIGTAGYLSVAQLQMMDAHGWDIANHTTDHTLLTTLSEADQETHIGDAADALDGWGLTRASHHLVFPNGLRNADTYTAMAATGMLTARSIEEFDIILPPVDNYNLFARNIINTTTLETFKGLIKTAMDNRTILSTYMHNIVANPSIANEWAIRDWRALCDYIAMSGIPTITTSELYSLLSGPVVVPMPY